MRTDISTESLAAACGEVLERMFFTDVLGDSEASGAPCPGCLCASLAFQGERHGWLHLEISRPAARSLSANFLGVEREEELTETAIGEVVCELANMICGTVLSHQGDSSQFDLATPVLCGPAGCAGTPVGVRRKFELENGDLTVSFTIGEPHA